MAQSRDRLGDVAGILLDLPVGVKTRHKPPAPFPRPETELDRARARQREERENAYDDRIMNFVQQAQDAWRSMTEEERMEHLAGGGR